jgi:hypothetical protein
LFENEAAVSTGTGEAGVVVDQVASGCRADQAASGGRACRGHLGLVLVETPNDVLRRLR